jgi:hypothetical protein
MYVKFLETKNKLRMPQADLTQLFFGYKNKHTNGKKKSILEDQEPILKLD